MGTALHSEGALLTLRQKPPCRPGIVYAAHATIGHRNIDGAKSLAGIGGRDELISSHNDIASTIA